jgi:hypothetical protein
VAGSEDKAGPSVNSKSVCLVIVGCRISADSWCRNSGPFELLTQGYPSN